MSGRGGSNAEQLVKRERTIAELRADPNRLNRDIAKAAGVSSQTVLVIRKQLGLPPQAGKAPSRAIKPMTADEFERMQGPSGLSPRNFSGHHWGDSE